METIKIDAMMLLKKEVEKKMNYSLRTPANFEALISRVDKEKHEMLSLSTVKRLWGYVKNSPQPRLSTLSILSRFVDFKDWDDFCNHKQIYVSENSGFLSTGGEQINNLTNGDKLLLEWNPDRVCRIVCEGPGLYRVVYAQNCKLRVGDVFNAAFFALGHPLYVSNLVRDDRVIGSYVAGKNTGLIVIKVEKTN